MNAKQFSQLRILAEKLCDIAIEEADPALWPGAGKKPNELTKQDRGDRVWTKKNAAATLRLVADIEPLIGAKPGDPAVVGQSLPAPSYEELEKIIADSKRSVERRLQRMKAGALVTTNDEGN